MIKINMSNGDTLSYNLYNEKDIIDFKNRINNPIFQKKITGISIYIDKQTINIKKPKNVNTLKWSAGKIAETSWNFKNNTRTKDIGLSISLEIDNKYKNIIKYYYSNKMVVNEIKLL